MSHTFTMRLSDEQSAALEAIALLTGVSQAEVMRRCIRDKLASITPDSPVVIARRAELERQLAMLDELPFTF